MISSQENDYIKQMMTEYHAQDIWLGGSDLLQEGTWYWAVSGGGLDEFSDWTLGQPDLNSIGDENCLEFALGKYGHWNDAVCSWEIPFICQRMPQSFIVG